MRRNKQNNPGPVPSDAGDMWHALAALRQTHSEPVGRLLPFERADALLSLTQPGDIAFTARVELSGGETMGHVHDLITTVTRGITYELGAAAPGTALEILLGKRHQLALHTDHVDGLSQLLRDAVTTIDAHSTPGGGPCSHCHGTGRAHPLWAPAAGQA
ncbi:hypothetical protein [Streptomyces sp. RerS4]|uniref:hypothetical protein n=1 Tax=Streptomyces sp. RerS4 TaxID=2942449 RepID=UPI00201BCEAC|nr:hypothetical protein [Streptomyces sp. RerS4]UQX04772.1 hypothetical protein M4D82_32900 [Streptomyces sp. RerS4]